MTHEQLGTIKKKKMISRSDCPDLYCSFIMVKGLDRELLFRFISTPVNK